MTLVVVVGVTKAGLRMFECLVSSYSSVGSLHRVILVWCTGVGQWSHVRKIHKFIKRGGVYLQNGECTYEFRTLLFFSGDIIFCTNFLLHIQASISRCSQLRISNSSKPPCMKIFTKMGVPQEIFLLVIDRYLAGSLHTD